MPQLAGTILVGSYLRPVAAGVGLRLYGSASGYVGLAPAASAGSTTFVLPAADGQPGDVLTTNGNGAWGWWDVQAQLDAKEPAIGTLGIAKGGTGSSAAPANGQLLIGNGTDFSLATLTAGDHVTITQGAGSITIAADGGGATPGGASGQLQFNDGGALGGSSNLTWSEGAGALTLNHTLTASDGELLLEQTGDQFGVTRFRLRNRLGYNGAAIENAALDLADLLLVGSSASAGLLRFEIRGGSVVDANNTGGEFQMQLSGASWALAVGTHTTTIFSHLKLNDGCDLPVGSSTGTKIATAASQKLGFFGASPIAQPQKANHNNWSDLSDVVQALVDLGLFDQA